MKIKFLLTIALLIATFLMTPKVFAQELRTAENYNLPKEQTITSSVATSSNTQRVLGTIEGNFYCTGQDVVITGTVTGNVFCASSSLKVSGQIDGDLFSLAQDLEISGQIDGSVIAFSSDIKLTETAKIRQDLTVAATNASLSGVISRDLIISATTASSNAIIGRDFKADVGSLVLYGDGVIKGNLTITSNNDVKLEGNAKVDGNTNRKPQTASTAAGVAIGVLSMVGFLLSLLLVSMITVLIMPNFYEKTYTQIHTKTASTFGWGLFNLLITPIIIVLIMLTVFGIPLAGLIAVAWILSLMLSGPILAYYIGKRIKKKSSPVVMMLIGSLVVLALYLVPIVNIVVGLIVGVVGSGALFELFKSSKLQTSKH